MNLGCKHYTSYMRLGRFVETWERKTTPVLWGTSRGETPDSHQDDRWMFADWMAIHSVWHIACYVVVGAAILIVAQPVRTSRHLYILLKTYWKFFVYTLFSLS